MRSLRYDFSLLACRGNEASTRQPLMKLEPVGAEGTCLEQMADMNSLYSFAITSACGFN